MASPIRKFAPLIRDAERQGVKVYKLNTGDPDIAPPREFFTTLRAYPSRNLGYAPSSGMPDHVAAWLKYYRNLGISLKEEHVIPTAGCAEAILFAMQVVADPGDELIVFEPLYVSYRSFSTMTGVRLVPIHLRLEDGFALPPLSAVERKITSRTRGIVIINPDNPTGKLWTSRELSMLVALARRRGLFVIADETYREIRFTGKPHSLLSSRAKDHIIVVDSVSKRFSLPGARVGCVVSRNKEVMEAILRFAQARLSVGTLEQFALQPLLRNAQRLTASLRKEYEKRCAMVCAELAKIPGVVCSTPRGAFYVFASLPLDSAERFVKFMLADFRDKKETVAVSPMRDFYITKGRGEREIRIACVVNMKDLERALQLIRRGLEAYRTRVASRKGFRAS